MRPPLLFWPRTSALLAATLLFGTACRQTNTAVATSTSAPAIDASTVADAHASMSPTMPPTSAQLAVIAQVRAATARFHDVEEAVRAGYTVQYPAGCAASASGAQGYHYLNPALAADAIIDPLTPELLMYEPAPNGRLELVGVDYVIKYSTLPANSIPTPTVLGVDMMHNDPLGVWALHIWSRRPNTSGMFAAWNPDVSCASQNVAKLPQLPQ